MNNILIVFTFKAINLVRRYKNTKEIKEKSLLALNENYAKYNINDNLLLNCIQIQKESISKNNSGKIFFNIYIFDNDFFEKIYIE
jgi:hypothetical protein